MLNHFDFDPSSPQQRRMTLSRLCRAAGGRLAGSDTEVSGISTDSRSTRAGELFVAIPGLTRNGEEFAPQALRRGAAAVCARQPLNGTSTLVVENPRRALAALAAEFYEHPAASLRLLGITGSLGKTSTALLLEHALSRAGQCAGVIGSLGVRFSGEIEYTRMTTPEAPAIHAALASMREQGATTVVMEVTSHSLRLERVAGLELALGIITNLVPDEHLEFHATPEDYLRTKARFLDLLASGAPLVANADDTNVRRMVRQALNPVVLVTTGHDPDAHVGVEDMTTAARGSRFTLVVRRPIPGVGTTHVEPLRLSLELSILGAQQIANAAAAATTALLAGVSGEDVAAALRNAPQIHRRMQVLHDAGPMIIDDTVGNAVSIHALFDTIDRIPHRRLVVVCAVRGSRGVHINEKNAETLARRLQGRDMSLTVTSSDDCAGPRDRVSGDECESVLRSLRLHGITHEHEKTLEVAVRRAIDAAGEEDLVLLMGAQGMDAAGGIVREALGLERRRSSRA